MQFGCIIIFSFILSLQCTETLGKFRHAVPPQTVIYTSDNSRIRGISSRKNVDFVVGAIFPVHNSIGGVCQEELFGEATDYMEAVLYAIDLINNDEKLLPNITLGYDLRDSCITENVALDESADMVLRSDSGDSCTTANSSSSESLVPVSVIIGGYASFVSIPVANFLRLFSVPQISIATSVILNDRERYGYFYRTVPSDDQQTQAIVDLALHFGWRYVSTLHSNDLYGEPGIDSFRKLAGARGICIDLDEGIDGDFTRSQYMSLASKVMNSSAKAIVFFSSLNQVNGLLKHLQELQLTTGQKRRFFWIAGDTWAESSVIISNYHELVKGMWGVVPRTKIHSGFYNYFSQLTPSNNRRNKWYTEYHEYYYNCTQNVSCGDTSIGLNSNYRNNSFTPFVIDAVYSFAYALHDFVMENCNKPIVWNSTTRMCDGQQNDLTGSSVRDYLKQVNFTSVTGNKIIFDETGSIEGEYFALNYREDSSGEYRIFLAAVWDDKKPADQRLTFTQNLEFQFSVDENGAPMRVFESQCQSCPVGQVNQKVQSSCCGTCRPCLGQNYTNSTTSTECSLCSVYSWGNNPLNGSHYCQEIAESYLDPSDIWGIVLIIVSIIGVIGVILIVIGMVMFWNKPIIKSSGREQMILLLVGASLCFLSTVFFIMKPSIPVCLFQRISTWLCFSIILSALFVKLVRIARIFLRKQGSGRPRFVEPSYQIIFTFLLVGFQMVLVTISLIVVYPESTKEIILNSRDTNDWPTLVVRCASPHFAMIAIQMLYYTFLLITSNALAMLTIRFPANFNEVRYVAFSTFSIGLIWLLFIIAYFATENEFRTAVISFAIQKSAMAVLVCMFGSRFMIIIFSSNKTKDSNGTDILSTLNNKANNKKREIEPYTQ